MATISSVDINLGIGEEENSYLDPRVSTGEALLRALNLDHHKKIGLLAHAFSNEELGEKRKGKDKETGLGKSKTTKAKGGLLLSALAVAATGAVISLIVSKISDLATESLPGFGEEGSDNDINVSDVPIPSNVDLPKAVDTEDTPIDTKIDKGLVNRGSKLAKPTDDVDQAIKAAAIKENIEYELLYAMIGVESSFRPNVEASTSSAQGLGQFTANTWTYLTTKVWPDLKYTLEDRTDPYKSSVVTSRYVKRIANSLKSVEPSPTIAHIYLGYFMGPTGSRKFLTELKKNPNQIGADLFPKQAKANPGIFFSKNKPLTLGKVMDKLSGKVTTYYVEAKNKTSSSQVAKTKQESPPTVINPKGAPTVTTARYSNKEMAPVLTASSTPKAQAITASVISFNDKPEQQQIQNRTSSSKAPGFVPSPTGNRTEGTLIRGKDDKVYAIAN